MNVHAPSGSRKEPAEPKTGEIVIYQDRHRKTNLAVRLEQETVWLSQAQMAELFGKDIRTISEHIRNVYKEGELRRGPTIRKFRIVQSEGKRQVARNLDFYNLDVIISVGYRVKSPRGTQFRIWATGVLRDHIIHGVTVNQKRVQELKGKQLEQFREALMLLESARQKTLSKDEAAGLLEIITKYAKAWLLLRKYDEGTLETEHVQKDIPYILTYEDSQKAIRELKKDLIRKKEAGELFGTERNHGLEAILGNLNQTFNGQDLYPSVEERAAHLLYFIIKDHPFADGNKRIGSLLFLIFLSRNHHLFTKVGQYRLNDNALVALALLVAESNPRQKDVMIQLTINLLSQSS